MNAVDLWDKEVFFDYVDRWMTEDESAYAYIDDLRDLANNNSCYPGQGTAMPQQCSVPGCGFVENMWEEYRY